MNDLLKALIVSGSLGALVGLERQWDEQARNPDVRIPAGLRTFCIIGLLGALCAHFSSVYHPMVFVGGLIALSAWLAAFIFTRHDEEPGSGLTTAAGAAMVYLIGGLVYAEQRQEAVILTVFLLILLAGKSAIHAISRKFTHQDVRFALQFLAVSGVVLPLVPDQAFGPFEAINPHSIWMMVVLVSGLGFAGYVAVRIFGQNLGILLTGMAGGLASSTATTLSMSRLSRERPAASDECALAAGLASTVMLWRVEILIFVISPPLAAALLPEMLVLSLPGVALAGWKFLRKSPPTESSSSFKNPLSLRVAIQFAALYALVIFIVKAAGARFGEAGLLVASFLSGLTDLIAIALSVANLLQAEGTHVHFAVACILLATVANSIIKLGFAVFLGSPRMRWLTLLVLGSTIGLGLGLFFLRLRV